MILYTPLAETDIFPLSNKDYENRQCITHEGRMCYVERNQDGDYQLVQLLSTDPQDYLNEKFAPGSIIS